MRTGFLQRFTLMLRFYNGTKRQPFRGSEERMLISRCHDADGQATRKVRSSRTGGIPRIGPSARHVYRRSVSPSHRSPKATAPLIAENRARELAAAAKLAIARKWDRTFSEALEIEH